MRKDWVMEPITEDNPLNISFPDTNIDDNPKGGDEEAKDSY